jgi:histone deacetylase complex subunit SAP130
VLQFDERPIECYQCIIFKLCFRFLWKCRYTYHFLHDSHVKGRDERKPTVNDLANQKDIMQKLDGWKVIIHYKKSSCSFKTKNNEMLQIRYLTGQLFDIIDEENDLTHNLEDFQRRLDKAAHPDISGRKELNKVQELIKANLQRSKAIRDQITEAKDTTMEIFNHKSKVAAIVKKYESKRFIKKKADLGV